MSKPIFPTNLHSYLHFLGSFQCFYNAVRRPLGLGRYFWGVWHVYSIVCCLRDTGLDVRTLSHIWIPFLIGFTVHTTSVIFTSPSVITKDATPSRLGRLRKVIRVWGNIRRLKLVDDTPVEDRPAEETIMRFTIRRLGSLFELVCLGVLFLMAGAIVSSVDVIIRELSRSREDLIPLINTIFNELIRLEKDPNPASTTQELIRSHEHYQMITKILNHWFMKELLLANTDLLPTVNYLIRTDAFSPIINVLINSKAHFIPNYVLVWQGMLLRTMTVSSWILVTYAYLTAAHDFLALLYVSILRLDYPSEWPPLFGWVMDAYSLRRFWGVFWHKLHVPMFDAWIPSWHKYTNLSSYCFCRVCCSLDGQEQGQTTTRQAPPAGSTGSKKTFRALWMFFLSAVCYSLVNLVAFGWDDIHMSQHLFFFLAHWMLCTAETTLIELVSRKLPGISSSSLLRGLARLLGYIWVWYVLFCLVPAWRVPQILLVAPKAK